MGMTLSALQLFILSHAAGAGNRRWREGWWQSWCLLQFWHHHFLSKMHCKKCTLNQVWTDSAAHHFEPGASTHIGRGTAGRWDNKRTLQGLGANPNGYRVFWSPLCSHKTIVINLNIVSASSGGLRGGVVRKIKIHFSQQRHEKSQELNTQPPPPQILQLW